jgi:hypothetical protein
LTIFLGKSGLIALSTILEYNTAASLGLHSLFLKVPPHILPAAPYESRRSTVRGKKSLSGLGFFSITAVTKRLLSPNDTTTAPSA